jgi:plastocyanin
MTDVNKPSLWARRGMLRLALGGSVLAAAASRARAEAAKVTVRIDNFAFVPAELKIGKGTEVTWTNNDDIPHTVLAVGTNIRSKTMDTDGTFTYKFDKPGTFNYICALHPHMKAKVIVTE